MTNLPTPSNNPLSRRQFLGSSARNAATAAVGVVGLSQIQPLQAQASRVAAGPVRLGFAGLRNQGAALLRAFQQVHGCQIAAVCEIDETVRLKTLQQLQHTDTTPAVYEDFRQLLDDRQVDAVVIATPDHHHAWMAALACDAGKDIYLEVPTTHTIEQGQQLRTMLRKSGVVVQTGLQHRSGLHYQSAIEYLHSGELGAVRFARAWACQQRQKLQRPHAPAESQPQNSFARQWLGEGHSSTPLNPADWHFHWRWMWDFGSGELGTWGVTLLDIARWGLNVGLPDRVAATGGCYHFQDGRETPDTLSVQYDFGETSIVWEHRQWTSRGIEGRPQGVAFYGERGVLIIDRSGWKVYDHNPAVSQPASETQISHAADFVAAVQQRSTPRASFETGWMSTQLCHLGNLSYRQGQEWRREHVPSKSV